VADTPVIAVTALATTETLPEAPEALHLLAIPWP
jgi:hypothetical protein